MTERRNQLSILLFAIGALTFSMTFPMTAWSHCDGLDGPVVTDARTALAAKDVTIVLKWLPEKDEQTIKDVFKQVLEVRKHDDASRELADRYFFETLVRLHREYEGAAFTGLRPAGDKVHPAIARADASLIEGDVDELARDIAHAVESSIRQKFSETLEANAKKENSVQSGREYVENYVKFVHYVKYLHDAVTGDHDHGHATTGD